MHVIFLSRFGEAMRLLPTGCCKTSNYNIHIYLFGQKFVVVQLLGRGNVDASYRRVSLEVNLDNSARQRWQCGEQREENIIAALGTLFQLW